MFNRIYIYKITFLVFVVVVGILFFLKNDPSSEHNQNLVDISKLEVGTNRTTLFVEMVESQRDKYDEENTFILDDRDPSTKVVLGAYAEERANDGRKPGGIIMLKRLGEKEDEIFLEIVSENFEGRTFPNYQVEDINNDGLKEIIITWLGGLGRPEASTEFWIVSINPHSHDYTILSNELGMHGFLNLKDLDEDGLDEIIITVPETAYQMGTPPWPKKIYKWNGSEYYLWKETTEPIN